MKRGTRRIQARRVGRYPVWQRVGGPLVGAGLLCLALTAVAVSSRSRWPVAEPQAMPVATASAPTIARFPTVTATSVATAIPRLPIVALDPGHGGPDDDLPRYDPAGRLIPWFREGENSGAVHRRSDGVELREKDLNLRLALASAELLERRGVLVMLTRRGDVPVNLENQDYNADGKVDLADELLARVDLVNRGGADLLVSIHFNAHSSPRLRGTYAQYASGRPFSDQSVELALAVHGKVLRGLSQLGVQPIDQGVEKDTETDLTGRHLVLLGPRAERVPLETTMPGALIEPLFLTNPEDVALLERADVLDVLAHAIADGILEHLDR